jgi:hypothetical protein
MSLIALEIVKEFFFPHRPQNAIPSLDGPWAPNDKLDQCYVLIDGLDQPDDLTVDDFGNLYVSVGYQVLRFLSPEYRESEIVSNFTGRTGGLAWDSEIGLIVCIDGEGVSFVGGRYDGLTVKDVGGARILSPTAIVVLPSGSVLLTDGSLHHSCNDWIWDLMEKGDSGRLIELTPETGGGSVLLDGLRYPAGLAPISGDINAVLITESWSHSISVVELGSGGARRRPVMSNLPGYPSRIVGGKDGYWLSFFALRTQLVEFILGEDAFRRDMMETVDPEFWIRPSLRATGHPHEPVQGGGIKQLGIMKPWAPPRSYGLIVELDHNIEVVQSLHSRYNGIRHGMMGLAVSGDLLFTVSKGMGTVLQFQVD